MIKLRSSTEVFDEQLGTRRTEVTFRLRTWESAHVHQYGVESVIVENAWEQAGFSQPYYGGPGRAYIGSPTFRQAGLDLVVSQTAGVDA